jgi:hypothetical protein
MADLKVTATGKIFYQLDNQLAAVLREAFPASFEHVQPPAPQNLKPHFAIEYNHGHVVKKPSLVFRYGPSTLIWQISAAAYGKPEAAEQEMRGFKPCGHAVPEEIIKRFLAANAAYELGG